jgi:putative endonuclease
MNSPSGVLYTGVTNDLIKRIYQHKHKLVEGFTKKYNVNRLAYFEESVDIESAIAREKEIKAWRRSKKVALIKSANPQWKDLAVDWYEEQP